MNLEDMVQEPVFIFNPSSLIQKEGWVEDFFQAL